MDFFSKILRHPEKKPVALNGAGKKILLFALLFFVVAGFAIPQSASAGWFDWASWGTNVIVNGIATVFLLYAFWIPLLFTLLFTTVTNIFLAAAINFATIGTSYTHSDAVNIGWPIVRDLANMMVVLGFVVIGIAFTLRIEGYGTKKTLINLIIAALLINFSLLICGLFIDGTNMLMLYFFEKAGGSVFSRWTPAIADMWTAIKNLGTDNILNFAAKIIGMIFFYLIAGFVNILYFFLILMRVIALWMLVILSPLAFVCYVFPATRSIFQVWWKNFFQWCIIIIPAGLFYYIGSKLVSISFTQHSAFDVTDISSYTEAVSNSVSTMFVPALFLIAGFLISLQTSAMGAGAITSFANKNKWKALGMGLGALQKAGGSLGGAAEWAGNKMGGGRVGSMFTKASVGLKKYQSKSDNMKATLQKARSNFGRLGEAAGFIEEGTAGAKDEAAVEAEAKRIKDVYEKAKLNNDRKTIERIREQARTGQGVTGAASYKVVSDAKDLADTFKNAAGGVDHDNIYARGVFAERTGAQGVVKDNEKLNPYFRRFNEFELEEKAKSDPRFSSIPNAQNDPLYRAQIQDAVEADGFKKATPAEIKNYHKSVLSSEAFIENVRTQALQRAANTELSGEQAGAVKAHIPYIQSEMKKCYLPNNNVVDPAKSDRYNELKRKLKVTATV